MTDKKKPAFINARRRGFLQGASLAGGALAGGVATAQALAGAEDDPVADLPDGSGKKGYERTDHVARYYARARI